MKTDTTSRSRPSHRMLLSFVLAALSAGCTSSRGSRPQLAGDAGTHAATAVLATSPASSDGAPWGGRPVSMEKFVTPTASFAVYRPAGWAVRDISTAAYRGVAVSDPSGLYAARLSLGALPGDADLLAAARSQLVAEGEQRTRLVVSRAWRGRDRAVAQGQLTGLPAAASRFEFRLWAKRTPSGFVLAEITAPEGRLDAAETLLLTVLSNLRALKPEGAAAGAATPPAPLPLVRRRLADGSATFEAPWEWKISDLGKGHFIASDPKGAASFLVASSQVLDPHLRVRVPGVVVAEFQSPHQALALLTQAARLGSGFEFARVEPMRDLNQSLARVYTAGPVLSESFVYTFRDAHGSPSKGFSFGVSFGSHTRSAWSLWHMTAIARVDSFAAMLPTFVRMAASYRISDAYARSYVEAGVARLRAMERETSRRVAESAQSIHDTMQAAYDERQKSHDYIDYVETANIRGTQDWISEVEGGAVYHSDSWGTKNTVTGEQWENAPFDYLHFTGRNPKYDEQLEAVDSRQLWEERVRER